MANLLQQPDLWEAGGMVQFMNGVWEYFGDDALVFTGTFEGGDVFAGTLHVHIDSEIGEFGVGFFDPEGELIEVIFELTYEGGVFEQDYPFEIAAQYGYFDKLPGTYGSSGSSGSYMDPGAAPPALCFWTDLVNVTQDCEEPSGAFTIVAGDLRRQLGYTPPNLSVWSLSTIDGYIDIYNDTASITLNGLHCDNPEGWVLYWEEGDPPPFPMGDGAEVYVEVQRTDGLYTGTIIGFTE